MAREKPIVLLVEDEPAQSEVLIYNLEAAGYAVQRAETGDDALAQVALAPPDVILLDWMLPGLSGIDVCRALKSQPETRAIPIIMLSARSEEPDKVHGLETGADDYVIKPYSMAELLARVRAKLRLNHAEASGRTLAFDDIRIEIETHRVTRQGRLLALGPTEFRLLVTFLEKPGRVFSRDQLLERVWGRDIHVDERTVDAHVARLRKALCEQGGDDPLRTVRGVGYAIG